MRAGILLACFGLVLACGRERQAASTAAAPIARAAEDAEGRLDPTPYRVQIETAQALLYDDEELSEDGWKALSKALLDLHNQIVFEEISPSARETSRRLFFFSASADAAASARHGQAARESLRDLWRQLCAEKFAPADWIHAESTSR